MLITRLLIALSVLVMSGLGRRQKKQRYRPPKTITKKKPSKERTDSQQKSKDIPNKPKTKEGDMTQEKKEERDQKLFGKTASDKPPKKDEWAEKAEDDTAEEKELKKMFKLPTNEKKPKNKKDEEKEELLFEKIEISQVYNDPLFPTVHANSSLEGGSTLYIAGQGFGTDLTLLQVSTGPAECVVFEVKDTLIQCTTTPLQNDHTLPVHVQVDSRKGICTGSCKVHFKQECTDVIQQIVTDPKDKDRLIIYGTFNKGIDQIQVGDYPCTLEKQSKEKKSFKKDKVDFSLNKEQNMQACRMDKNMPQGKYNITISNKNGKVQKQASSKKYSKDNQQFEVQTKGEIKALSTNKGTTAGGVVKIYGDGFGNQKDKVKISLKDKECKVLELKSDCVECEFQQLDKDSTDSKDNEGGSGVEAVFYKVPNINKDMASLIDLVKNQKLEEVGRQLIGDFELKGEKTDKDILMHVSGYLESKDAGDYKFTTDLVNQDEVVVSVQVGNEKKTVINQKLTEEEFKTQLKSKDAITLEANKKYLLETFVKVPRAEKDKPDSVFMALGVRMPSSKKKANSANKIEKISIKPQKEKQELKLMNVKRGYYYLQTDKFSKKIPFNANAKVLKKQLDLLCGGDAKVKKHKLNSNGDIDDNLSKRDVKGFSYEIEYQGMRKDSKQAKVYTRFLKKGDGELKAEMKQLTSREGSQKYKLELDGKLSEDIDMYDDQSTIKRKLMAIGYSKDIQVSVQGQPQGDQQILIEFKNQTTTQENKKLKIQGDNKDWVAMEREQDSSNDQIFMPVSEDMMKIHTNKTQLRIEVDGQSIPCSSKVCSFEVKDEDDTPKIEDFDLLDNGTLTVTLDKDFKGVKKNMTLKLGNNKCTVKSISDKKVKCDFAKDSSGTLLIEGGELEPRLSIDGVGTLKKKDSLTKKKTMSPTVTSIAPSTGSKQGGQKLVITGKYFPFKNNTDTVIKQGDIKLKVFKMTNTKIEVMTIVEKDDAATKAVIHISIGGIDVTQDYNYAASADANTLTALSSQTIAPHSKVSLDLTFKENLSTSDKYEVYLQGDKQKYVIKNTSVDAKKLTVKIPGVRSGKYTLDVYQENYGMVKSTADQKIKAEITVTGIAPNKGAVSGNTKLVITGTNLKHNSAYVYLGDKNNTCVIIENTATSITCLTQKYKAGKAKVSVMVRDIDIAKCDDTTDKCDFTHDTAATPSIDNQYKEMFDNKFDDILTFTGKNLLDSSITANLKNAVLMLNDEYFIYATSQSATELKFKLDNDKIKGGKYMMRIYVKPFGMVSFTKFDQQPIMKYSIKLDASAPSDNEGSYAGSTITLTGNGFDKLTTVQSIVGDKTSKCMVWVKKAELKYRCPSFEPKADGKAKVMVMQDGESVSNFTYTNKEASTQTFKKLDKTVAMTSDNFKIEVKLDTSTHIFGDETPTISLSLVDKYYKKYDATLTKVNDGFDAKFTDVPIGNYVMNVEYQKGLGFFKESDKVKLTSDSLVVGNDYKDQSFSGGIVQLSGKGLKRLHVEICGLPCSYVRSDYTTLDCVQNGMNLEESSQETTEMEIQDELQAHDITAKGKMPMLMQDGDIEMYYKSTENDDKILFDFGKEIEVEVNSIMIHPYKLYKALNNAVFETSSDGTTFTELYNVDIMEYGWNSLFIEKQNKARYIRLSFKSSGERQIAEIMFFGLKHMKGLDSNTESKKCDIDIYEAPGKEKLQTITEAVTFKKSVTGKISSISPKVGLKTGKTEVKVTGKAFGTVKADVKVFVGEIACTVSAITDTEVTCETQENTGDSDKDGQQVSVIKGKQMIKNDKVRLEEVELWSETTTWNGEAVPSQGETVIIPAEKNILIDEDVDVGVIQNYGKIQTKEDKDISVDAESIYNIGGKIKVETTTNKHKLNIREVLYNEKGEVSIKGKERKAEGTVDGELKAGDDKITLKGEVDFEAGEEILIPTMDNNRTKSEVRKVVSYDKSTKKITLNETLKHDHIDENIDALVVLMDRNVELTGKKTKEEAEKTVDMDGEVEEDNGFIINEGTGKQGMKVKIKDAKIKNLGSRDQESIQFNDNGDAHETEISGNYVEKCANKVIKVKGSDKMKIKKNSMWKNKGSNIVLENTKDINVEGNIIQDVDSNKFNEKDKEPAAIILEQSSDTLKDNKIRNSHDGIKISSVKNDKFNTITGNKVHNVDNSALEIDNKESLATGEQEIDDFKAYNNGRGVYIKSTNDIKVKNFDLRNNQQNLNVEEEEKTVKFTDGEMTGLSPKMAEKYQKMNKTTVGMQVPMSDKFEIDNLTVKGYDNNKTSLFKVNPSKNKDKQKKNEDEDVQMKEVLNDRNMNQDQKEKKLEEMYKNYNEDKKTKKQGVPKFKGFKYEGEVKKMFGDKKDDGKIKKKNEKGEEIPDEEDKQENEDEDEMFFKFKDEDGSMTGTGKTGFVGKEKKEQKGLCKIVKNNAQVCDPDVDSSTKSVKIFGTLIRKNQQYKLIVRDLKQKKSPVVYEPTKELSSASNGNGTVTAGGENYNGNKTIGPPPKNMSDYSTYKSKDLIFEIEVVAGMQYELEINDGQQIEELQLMVLGEEWKKEDKGVMLRFLVNSTYDEYTLKADNQQKKQTNINKDDYDMGGNQIELNYQKDKGAMDIKIHGYSDVKTKIFRMIKIKRKQNAKAEVVTCDKEITFRNYSDVSNWEGGVLPSGPKIVIPCEWRMISDIDMLQLEELTIFGELIFQNDPMRPVQMVMADKIHIKPTGILTAGNDYQKINESNINIISNTEIINEGSLNLFGGKSSQPSSAPGPDSPPIYPEQRMDDQRNETSFNQTMYYQNGTQFNHTVYRKMKVGNNGTDGKDPEFEQKFYNKDGSEFTTKMYHKNGTELVPPEQMMKNETLEFKNYLNQTDAFKEDMKKQSKSRTTLSAKLMKESEANSMEIYLDTNFIESVQEGDSLFISATQMQANEGELVDVTNMEAQDDGVTYKVTLLEPLKYYHYGSIDPDEIDERALVIRIGTNNNMISIQGPPKIELKGPTSLVNIQFTQTGSLQIKSKAGRKLVAGCSFNSQPGHVIEADGSHHVHIVDNQIVQALGDAVAIRGNHNDTIVSRNLIMGVQKGIYIEKLKNNERNNSLIEASDNVLIGIEGTAIDGFQHNNRNLKMINNIIGVAKLAIKFVSSKDASLHQHIIYRCQLGVQHLEMNQFETVFDRLLMVANKQYFLLRQAAKSYRNIIVKLSSSMLMGYAHNQRQCSNSQGMMVYQPNIKNYVTSKRNNYQLDGMNLNNAVLQVDRVQMVNFDANEQCKANRMFSVDESQIDSIQLFITKTQFINSSLSEDALNYSSSNKTATTLCSDQGCTGNRMVLFSSDKGQQMISPEAHSLLSTPSQPLCTKVTNYYICNNQSLQLLQIENWKFFKRQTLHIDTLVYNTTNNTQRVDSVKGLKIGKYIYDRQIWQTLPQNGKLNTIRFQDNTPYNLRFKLQENPSMSADNYMVLKIMLGRDSACRVYANKQQIASLIESDSPDLFSQQNRVCGTNYYNSSDMSLQFVLTYNCTIRYKLQDAVKVAMHLNTNFDDFVKTNGKDSFRTKMSTFLKVPTSQVLITNLRSGSVYVDFFITPEDTNSDEISEDPTTQTAPVASSSNSLLEELKNNLETAVKSGSIDVGSPVLGMTSSVVALPNEVPKQPGDDEDNNNADEGDMKVALIVGLIVGLFALIGVVSTVIYMKRRIKRIKQFNGGHQLEESPSQIMNKNNKDFQIVNQNNIIANQQQQILQNQTNLSNQQLYIQQQNAKQLQMQQMMNSANTSQNVLQQSGVDLEKGTNNGLSEGEIISDNSFVGNNMKNNNDTVNRPSKKQNAKI